MSDPYYNLDDPDGPTALQQYGLLRVGMRVRYCNPAFLQPDGTYKTGGMDPPLVVSGLYQHPFPRFGGEEDHPQVSAVLNEGEWEVSADNLVPEGDIQCWTCMDVHACTCVLCKGQPKCPDCGR